MPSSRTERKWNDEVMGIKLVAGVGCLVAMDGKWGVIERDMVGYRLNGLECYLTETALLHCKGITPVLPRVPEGKTCWDVFAWCMCQPCNVSDFAGVATCELQVYNLLFDRPKMFHAGGQVGIELVPRYGGSIDRMNLPLHTTDIQQYGALLGWIAINEVQNAVKPA